MTRVCILTTFDVTERVLLRLQASACTLQPSSPVEISQKNENFGTNLLAIAHLH